MTKVNLLGTFSLLHPTSLSFDVKSPGEVIKALCAQLKGFKELLSVANVCLIADGERSIHLDEISIESNINTLDIVPMSTGCKSRFLIPGIEILLGGLLIAGGIWAGATGNPLAANLLIGLGASLIAGGLSALILGGPPKQKSTPNNPSTLFNGAQNICQEGSPVPLAYGLCRIGSNLISAQITVNDVPV